MLPTLRPNPGRPRHRDGHGHPPPRRTGSLAAQAHTAATRSRSGRAGRDGAAGTVAIEGAARSERGRWAVGARLALVQAPPGRGLVVGPGGGAAGGGSSGGLCPGRLGVGGSVPSGFGGKPGGCCGPASQRGSADGQEGKRAGRPGSQDRPRTVGGTQGGASANAGMAGTRADQPVYGPVGAGGGSV